MANQHRLVNVADNRASSVSSSPPRRLNGLTLNMIPTSDNGGWTHLSSIRERDNNSFSSSYPTIGGQTGVGPVSPAAGNNISDVMSTLPFGSGVNTTTTNVAATTGRIWWNQRGGGVNTTTTAATTVPRRHGSFVTPPSSPLLSEQYMQTDSTLASSENPARPGGNNNIFISASEIRTETDRLMDEIQSTLQHLRNGGSIRSEDMMILDFLVTINPLIDSDDWSNQIMMALEGHIGMVERGLTEEEILRRIYEETYQFNPDETSTQNQTCTICQEDFVDGESIGRLNCIHVYHLQCIKQWLELRNTCPICKRRGLEINEDEDGN